MLGDAKSNPLNILTSFKKIWWYYSDEKEPNPDDPLHDMNTDEFAQVSS